MDTPHVSQRTCSFRIMRMRWSRYTNHTRSKDLPKWVVRVMQREYFRRELEREWEWIEAEEKKLEDEKKKVVTEWVAVEEVQKEYNRKRESFEKLVLERFQFLPASEVVAFNVGGQLFKSTVKVWTRDRFSILAQLCTTKPKLPKLCLEEDAYYFDRDFWIFQFIYAFLRDNALPDAIETLRELYCEASFYRIGLLRHAIEAKMIGDDAVLSSTAFPRAAAAASSQSSTILPPNTASLKKDSSKKNIDRKDSKSPGQPRFSELPDPFGFISKN